MVKKALIISIVFLISFSIFAFYKILSSAPTRIIASIVGVEQASGVIIYSDNDYSLILSAYHVVADAVSNDKNISITIAYGRKENIFGAELINMDRYEDLVLLKINNKQELYYSKISLWIPELADRLFLAGNPNGNYNTIVRGTLSSKNRTQRGRRSWQISGGTIYGSSGGGAFNLFGDLVGITKSVNTYNTQFCATQHDSSDLPCLYIAVPFIGYYVPLEVIRSFLTKSLYKDHFKYLE